MDAKTNINSVQIFIIGIFPISVTTGSVHWDLWDSCQGTSPSYSSSLPESLMGSELEISETSRASFPADSLRGAGLGCIGPAPVMPQTNPREQKFPTALQSGVLSSDLSFVD